MLIRSERQTRPLSGARMRLGLFPTNHSKTSLQIELWICTSVTPIDLTALLAWDCKILNRMVLFWAHQIALWGWWRNARYEIIYWNSALLLCIIIYGPGLMKRIYYRTLFLLASQKSKVAWLENAQKWASIC